MLWLFSIIICLCILLIPFKNNIQYIVYTSKHGYIYVYNMKYLGVLPSGKIYIYKRFPYDTVGFGCKSLISIYPLNINNYNTVFTKIILAYSSFL
jgi:hypothetical protein